MASKYRQRTESLYTEPPFDDECSGDPYILQWWSNTHDLLLLAKIKRDRWLWHKDIAQEILDITPKETIDHWKDSDPFCRGRTIKGALAAFARVYARDSGLIKHLRPVAWKQCLLCNEQFVEDSLPLPLIRRIGINQIDYCSPCLTDIFFNDVSVRGTNDVSYEDALSYLQDLASVLAYIPPRDFGTTPEDTAGLNNEQKVAVFSLLQRRPSIERIRELFGSWFEALVAAGVLEDGTQQMALGTKCLAKDGHLCLSLGEKTIDDLLYECGIAHEKEVVYPEGNYRADFVVNGIFIEYFGLLGSPVYDAKTRLKQKICKKHNINLISLYPKDLLARDRLRTKLIEGVFNERGEYNARIARASAQGQLSMFSRNGNGIAPTDEEKDGVLLFSNADVNGQFLLFPDAPVSRQLLLFLPVDT